MLWRDWAIVLFSMGTPIQVLLMVPLGEAGFVMTVTA
jgi:hypothetical protein